MKICVALLMLTISIATNALPSEDGLTDIVVPETSDMVDEILLMQHADNNAASKETLKRAEKGSLKDTNPQAEHLKHVHERVQDLKTTHRAASQGTQAQLAGLTLLLATASSQSSHNHSALSTAINTAINSINSDISSGHSSDSTYISNLYSTSTSAVSSSESTSLTTVNTKKSTWCPAKRALEDATTAKTSAQTTLQNVFASTAAMMSTCTKTWTESKATVESAFDSVTNAKSTYQTAKDAYDLAVSTESSASTNNTQAGNAFTTTLNNEATNTNSACTSTKSMYDAGKAQVTANVATRKHTKTLLEYLRCYVTNVLDGTATAADVKTCNDQTIDTTAYDITMQDMAACTSADSYKTTWGPTGWQPTTTNCATNGGAVAWVAVAPAPVCSTQCGQAPTVLAKYECKLSHSSQSGQAALAASRCVGLTEPAGGLQLSCAATAACTAAPTGTPTAAPTGTPTATPTNAGPTTGLPTTILSHAIPNEMQHVHYFSLNSTLMSTSDCENVHATQCRNGVQIKSGTTRCWRSNQFGTGMFGRWDPVRDGPDGDVWLGGDKLLPGLNAPCPPAPAVPSSSIISDPYTQFVQMEGFYWERHARKHYNPGCSDEGSWMLRGNLASLSMETPEKCAEYCAARVAGASVNQPNGNNLHVPETCTGFHIRPNYGCQFCSDALSTQTGRTDHGIVAMYYKRNAVP